MDNSGLNLIIILEGGPIKGHRRDPGIAERAWRDNQGYQSVNCWKAKNVGKRKIAKSAIILACKAILERVCTDYCEYPTVETRTFFCWAVEGRFQSAVL